MGAKVIIEWQGLDNAIARLTEIEEKAPESLATQVRELAKDTEQTWREATPRKTGRLQGADEAKPDGLSFTLNNSTRYYKFRDEGHWTPRGWRTKHGYRPAKRRSHVEGAFMTDKAVEFIEQNAEEYLSKFLDNV